MSICYKQLGNSDSDGCVFIKTGDSLYYIKREDNLPHINIKSINAIIIIIAKIIIKRWNNFKTPPDSKTLVPRNLLLNVIEDV